MHSIGLPSAFKQRLLLGGGNMKRRAATLLSVKYGKQLNCD